MDLIPKHSVDDDAIRMQSLDDACEARDGRVMAFALVSEDNHSIQNLERDVEE